MCFWFFVLRLFENYFTFENTIQESNTRNSRLKPYMNIDLLFTAKGEAGLLSSENLVKKAAGVVLDTQTGTLTIEYADMDYMDLNIPIEHDFFPLLDRCAHIHIGAIKNGAIAQAYQIPLMFQDDPYRSEHMAKIPPVTAPLLAFDRFVKSCVKGQPAHREDLGDETAMGCILGDSVPSALQFAPHLARRHGMEAAPQTGPQTLYTPQGPSLGLGGSSGGGRIIPNRTPPRKTQDDDSE